MCGVVLYEIVTYGDVMSGDVSHLYPLAQEFISLVTIHISSRIKPISTRSRTLAPKHK
jgi:hypothetical protein